MNTLFSLLFYRAFRPDFLDVEETLASRFRLRRSAPFGRTANRLIIVSAGRVHWRATVATFDRQGKPSFSPTLTSPSIANRDALASWLRAIALTNRISHVAVGIGHGFVVSAMSAVPRMSDRETMRLLRTDAPRLLGEGGNPQDINALVHHPRVENSCLRFTLRAQELASVREVCHAAGLQIVRIVCEQAQLLELAYDSEVASSPEIRALLLTLPTSFLFIQLDDSGWSSVTYDPALDEQAIGALLHAASNAIPAGGKLAYIDAGMPGMGDLLHSLAGFSPKPLTGGLMAPSFAAIAMN